MLAICAAELSLERGRARQCVEIDRGADPGSVEHVAQIADQAVGHIDRGAGDAAQRQAQRNARGRTRQRVLAGCKIGAFEPDPAQLVRDRQRRIAELAGDPDRIAAARSAATQRFPGRHFTEHRDAKIARTARRVAADEIDGMLIRQREKTARERRQPGFVDRGQRTRQQRPARRRAHRRQIRQVDRQRLVAERLGFRPGEKMAALDEHVDRRGDFETGRWRDQRRIVADAEHGVARRAPEVPLDELEFGQPASAARAVAASLSSTPLTYLCPSVPP